MAQQHNHGHKSGHREHPNRKSKQDNLNQSATAMRRTLRKLYHKRLSFLGKFGTDKCKDDEIDDGKFVGLKSRLASWWKFCNKRAKSSLVSESKASLDGHWNEMEYSESQNSVGTLDLFRYAKFRELAAICCGILFMIYAASWQPISVFILAIMASLMGQYTKRMNWLKQLNNNNTSTATTMMFAQSRCPCCWLLLDYYRCLHHLS